MQLLWHIYIAMFLYWLISYLIPDEFKSICFMFYCEFPFHFTMVKYLKLSFISFGNIYYETNVFL